VLLLFIAAEVTHAESTTLFRNANVFEVKNKTVMAGVDMMVDGPAIKQLARTLMQAMPWTLMLVVEL